MKKSDRLNRYHVGDARSISAVLPSKPVIDVTITSPPYWNLKDYGLRKQIGFGQDYEEYLAELGRIFRSIHQFTKDTGSLWIVADTIKCKGEVKLFPFDLARILQNHGPRKRILQDVIIWNKDKTLPWSHRGKLRNIFEYGLFFTKTNRFKYCLSAVRNLDEIREWWVRYPERYSPLGKAPAGTWEFKIPRQGSWGENWVRHFCPFPPDLVRRIIQLTTDRNDIVFDPFAGSGVVLAQAKSMNRRYVGIDISDKYRGMFERRVLPSIQEQERARAKQMATAENQRKLFASTIRKLRKIKYARRRGVWGRGSGRWSGLGRYEGIGNGE